MIRKKTGEGRAAARQSIGDLLDLSLTKARVVRNRKAANSFLLWARRKRYQLTFCNQTLVQAIIEYMREAWQDGESKEMVSDLLQSFKHLMPSETIPLGQAWRLYRQWAAKELPDQAPPCTLQEVLAYAGLAFQEGKGRCGTVCLGAYDGFLRTGEFLHVTPDDVEFGNSSTMVVALGETKGVKRRGGAEFWHCGDPMLVKLWKRAVELTKPGETVIGMSESQFRAWFKKATKTIALDGKALQPYSFRRGGITNAVMSGTPASTVIFRARWHSPKVALLYIQEGQELLRKQKLTTTQTKRLTTLAMHIGHWR